MEPASLPRLREIVDAWSSITADAELEEDLAAVCVGPQDEAHFRRVDGLAVETLELYPPSAHFGLRSTLAG